MHSILVAAAAALVTLTIALVTYAMTAINHPRNVASSQFSNRHAGFAGAILAIVAAFVRLLLELGVGLGPMMLLTVPGRKTGAPRTSPVDVFEHNGHYWLVATHTADANWVQNLCAAGRGTLHLGRWQLAFSAVELPPGQAAEVLKSVLGPRLARPVAGFVLRQTLAVQSDAPLSEFLRAAEAHPVFELAVTDTR